ncbi:ClpP/crotonase-like domain-containing protein [Emericellopsis atlantica]|uniref:ClpP/crotonase-like domain-containing protein n=1 Tax=Emericellopsis atlantica TaxID=2614577 RepID=A0A9P8CN77_9HYPO|nr:ClpP/crotonase-like domain-containing protein [Emericellopsis atlantica]KAG9253484.1 ClpP/crotonase-like domain-containing protein [Emericellopsis atlantica]
MADALVTVSTPSDGVRVLAFNRPTKRNALSQDLIDQLLQGLTTAANDSLVRVIVVTGSSTFFSAGADIKEISQLDAEMARQRRYLEDLCTCIAGIRKPILAAVEGMALGGGFEVTLMCDIIFASNTARFGLPEVSIGLLPGAGGTQRLTNAVGKFKAMQVILLGKQIEAPEAHAAGLVADIYEPGTVLEETLTVAAQLAGKSSTAVALSKEAIKRADDLGRDDEFERSLYYFAFGTADKREGVAAFLEKRTPTWKTG